MDFCCHTRKLAAPVCAHLELQTLVFYAGDDSRIAACNPCDNTGMRLLACSSAPVINLVPGEQFFQQEQATHWCGSRALPSKQAMTLTHTSRSSCALGRTIRVQHSEGGAKVAEDPRKHAADVCAYEANTRAVAELVYAQRIGQRSVCQYHHLKVTLQPVSHKHHPRKLAWVGSTLHSSSTHARLL